MKNILAFIKREKYIQIITFIFLYLLEKVLGELLYDFLEAMYVMYEKESNFTIYTLIILFFSVQIFKHHKRRTLRVEKELVYHTLSDYNRKAFFYSVGATGLFTCSIWFLMEHELPQLLKFVLTLSSFSVINAIIYQPFNKFKVENSEVTCQLMSRKIIMKTRCIIRIKISNEEVVFTTSENQSEVLDNLDLNDKWKERIYQFFKQNSNKIEITYATDRM